MEYLNIVVVALLVGVIFLILFRGRGQEKGQENLLIQQQMDALRQETRQGVDRFIDSLQRNNEALSTRVQQQMDGLRNETGLRLGQLTEQVNKDLHAHREIIAKTHETLGNRLEGTTKVVSEVHSRLGELHKATHRLEEISKDIASLQDILKPPKLRGELGELLLANLLRQVVPNHFSLQHRFQNNEVVDAVITLGERLVPVDAKFPVDDFRRFIEAGDEEARKRARREFIASVKKEIDKIASKYIRPEEGTFDFALMYIPAENVYYETIIKDDTSGDEGLFEYSLKKRVIPVSPNTFYSYLQTILLGLKGMQVEERVEEVVRNLQTLKVDFSKFGEDFDLLGKHLRNCLQRYDDACKDLNKFGSRLERIESLGEDGAAKKVKAPQPEQRELL